MANLGEITSRLPELAVPAGFAITAAAYELFLSHNQLQDEINRRLQTLEATEISDLYRKSSEVQMLIINAEMPPALEVAITEAYAQIEARVGLPCAWRCAPAPSGKTRRRPPLPGNTVRSSTSAGKTCSRPIKRSWPANTPSPR